MTIRSFADAIRYLSPPLCVMERLAAQEASLCADGASFLARWRALRRGEPLGELDAWLEEEYGPASGPRPSTDTDQRSGAEGRSPQAAGESASLARAQSSLPAHGPGGIGAGPLRQQGSDSAARNDEGGPE